MTAYGWMPPLLLFSDYNNNWHTYIEALYSYYKADFIDSQPCFQGQPLRIKRAPKENEKDATFWHIISEGLLEADRVPDLRRCERIRWPKPVINHANEKIMKIWENKRRNERRICIWFESYEYLVIIAKRSNYLLFWTSYPVPQEHSKRKLLKEYQAYKTKAAH